MKWCKVLLPFLTVTITDRHFVCGEDWKATDHNLQEEVLRGLFQYRPARKSCPDNCVDSECSALGCVQCDEGFYLFPDPVAGKSVCIEACPDGYYTNPVNWCEECETANCEVCSDEYTCTECKPGYEVNKDGVCLVSDYQV